MASTAVHDKGKLPMFPEGDPTNAKPSSLPNPEADGAEEKKPAAEGEGAEDDLVLVTDCGTNLRLSRTAARMSPMLYDMMESDCAESCIPVQNVDAGILRMVAAYHEKHGPYYDPAMAGRDHYPFPPFPINLRPVTNATVTEPDPHGLSSWDQEFITAGIDNNTLFAIIVISNSNYLGIEDLIDLGCMAVADKMRGKTPEQIREVFDIENDYTPEQEAEVRKENAWAFED